MRKQSKKKRTNRYRVFRLVILAGFLFTMGLIFLVSTLGNQRFGSLYKLIFEATGPVQHMTARGTAHLQRFKEEYLELLSVREKNKRLWEELQECRRALYKSREAMALNVRLHKLLEFKEKSDLPVITASVIGKDPSLWFRSITIDRGINDGVFQGGPVINNDGIIGQVFSASPNYGKVLLAIAPSSAIDVLLQKNRVRGILKGTGSLTYRLEYILKTVEVEEGDHIVTAGYGGVFPTGLPVGVISKVIRKRRGMFHEIEVTPSVDFKTLENLFIIEQKQ